MRKHFAVFRRKECIGIQNLLGRFLHGRQRLVCFLFEDLATQLLQAKCFRLNLLCQSLQLPLQAVLFFLQRLPAAVQLFLLLRQAALVANCLQLASAVLVLRDFV